jgi:hypothetical protein
MSGRRVIAEGVEVDLHYFREAAGIDAPAFGGLSLPEQEGGCPPENDEPEDAEEAVDPLAILLKKAKPVGALRQQPPKKPSKPPPKGYKGMAYEPGTARKTLHAIEDKVRANIKKAGAKVFNRAGGVINIAATDQQAAKLRKMGYGVYEPEWRNLDMPSQKWAAKQGKDYKMFELAAWELPEEHEHVASASITEAIGVDLSQFRELSGLAPSTSGVKVMGEGHHHRAAEEGRGILIEAKYENGTTFWARRASDSKTIKINQQTAEKVIKRPAAKSAADAPDDFLLIWIVPPIYKKEAKWRIDHGWINPSWAWEQGELPGGIAESLHEDKRAHDVMMKLKEGDKVRIFSHELRKPRVVTVLQAAVSQGKVQYVTVTSGKPWGTNPKGGALSYRKEPLYGKEPDEVAFQATLSQRPMIVTKLEALKGEAAPGPQDGRGKGRGISGGGGRNKNTEPCPFGGPGFGKGGGRGKGAGREAVGAGFDEWGSTLTPDNLIDYLKTGPSKDITVAELAYSFKMSPQKVKAVLAQMVKKGQLKSAPTKGDPKTLRYFLGESESPPYKQGQLRPGMKIPWGQDRSSMIFMVMNVSGKRASLERVFDPSAQHVDVGAKLAGKANKLVLQWDGTGYGQNKYKGTYQKQQGNPKVYARPDGIY